MRLVIHGQQAFGKAVLEKLIERGDNVVGVFCAPDKEGRPLDPLKEYALENGQTVHQPTSWKTDEALELMKSFKPDLCIMAYVTLLVSQEVIDAPTHGTIQYHPSLLPLHRGPSSINWPIIQGAKKRRFISTNDFYSSRYYDRAVKSLPIDFINSIDTGTLIILESETPFRSVITPPAPETNVVDEPYRLANDDDRFGGS